jgi:tripartite-type tricarboxylate transporter receptor subunit TctC
MNIPVRALLLAALAGSAGLAHAQTQSWPTRPIRVIVSFPAGSAPDIICRFVTDRLSRALGQQIVVDNRPGSGNIIAAQAAARSAPDGYNFFCATAATLVSNPHTFKSLPYDPSRDFVPVAMIAKGPFFVLVHPGIPVKTLAELVAYDKANPGKLAWATDGLRNFTGMMAAWLNKIAGTNILTVPYATMPLGIQDTIAGRTQLAILASPASSSSAGFLSSPRPEPRRKSCSGSTARWTGSSRIRKRCSGCAPWASSPRAPRRPGRSPKTSAPIPQSGAGS